MGVITKVGSEFLVNTETASDQTYPTITGLTNGGFVVTWVDKSGTLGDDHFESIKAQVFGADGAKVGGEFLVNTLINGPQATPTTTALADGGFVIVWTDTGRTSLDGDGGSTAQIFAADGAKVGSQFLVNSDQFGRQTDPSVTGLTNGGFVVTWQDTNGDASGTCIEAQVFGADGTKVGDEFLVNTQTGDNQHNPTITALTGGGFVVTWWDNSGTLGDDSESSIKAQVFGADGTKVGTEFLVNTNTAINQYYPTITGLANGGFVVTWQDESGTLGDPDGSIKAQIFSADGTKVGSEFLVNSITTSGQSQPTITALTGGAFVVTWTDNSGTLGDAVYTSVKAQAFSANGTRIGDEFLVNTETEGYQQKPAVTGLTNGGFVVTWYDYTVERGEYNIRAQIFGGVPDYNFVNGGAKRDKFVGTSGDDWIDGGAGNDRMAGGTGHDIYIVDAAGDRVIEFGGEGTDTVRTKLAQYALGRNLENLIFTDDGAHRATGNAMSNHIIGGAGNDELDGKGGADTLEGDAGDDRYLVGNMGDVVVEQLGGGSDSVFATVSYVLSANVENLKLKSSKAALTATGNDTANTLIGNGNANVIDGKGGADRIVGGKGLDTLTGGEGADTFVFDTKPATNNADTITDFVSGNDVIALDQTVYKAFAATGALADGAFWSGAGVNTAHDADDRLVYNTTTGQLWYDADGTGKAKAVLVATLAGDPELAVGDFLIVA